MPGFLGQIPRSAWINDDGTRTKGTPLNDAELQKIYDAVETITLSGNFPNIALNSLLDNIIAGIPFDFGGDRNVGDNAVAYPIGGAMVDLAPGTRPLNLDAAHILKGTYRIEAVLQSSDAAQAASIALFNLTDAPDVALAGSEISAASIGGALVQSAPVTGFAAAGASKVYGIKLKSANVGSMAKAWGVRLVRTE